MRANNDICVVLVTNELHLQRCFLTVWQLRLFGKYMGDIVIIVGDDLKSLIPTISSSILKVKPKYFPELDRSQALKQLRNASGTSEVVLNKPFQFHKIHVFSTFFKQWRKILYLDTKMRVFNPIGPILNLDCENSLVAHSDGYPEFNRTFSSQFNTIEFPELSRRVNRLVSLSNDYFQTGMMLFDTSIISEKTVEELQRMSEIYVNSNTNEQGIINIWAQSRKIWRRLPTLPLSGKLIYDFHEREPHRPQDYLLLKYPRNLKEGLGRKILNKLFRFYWRIFALRLRKE